MARDARRATRHRSRRRPTRVTTIAATAAVALLAGVVPALSRATRADAAAPPVQVVAVGSPTSEQPADTILADAISSHNAASGASDAAWNLYAPTRAGLPVRTSVVPADANCSPVHTYTTSTTPPAGSSTTPDGSAAGVAALVAAEGGNWPVAGAGSGCVALARSDVGPRGTAIDGSASLVFDAYALDAVSWATASVDAPATLSQAQIQGIYNCTITDWGQVGGLAGHPIVRYLPRSGTDLRALFVAQVLGGSDPSSISSSTPPPGSTFPCPPVVSTQLDHGGAPLDPDDGAELDNAGYQSAILPYDTSAWIYQANNRINPSIDVRNGVKLGAATPTGVATAASYLRWNTSGVWELNYQNAANPNAPVTELQAPEYVAANGAPASSFAGVHYDWFVGDTVNPDFALTQALVGFTNIGGGARSPLCSGSERGALVTQGFGPLPTTSGGEANLAGATCRLFGEPGSLWGWGYDLYSHLGDGGTTTKLVPERVDPGRSWATVSSGYYEAAAITTDGHLFTWGNNVYGQLGDGTTTNRSTPTPIASQAVWSKVSIDYRNGAAITPDGRLYTWGDNTSGQLGDGTTTPELSPERIGADHTWAEVSVGQQIMAAVTTDGQLYTWGNNADGELGDGTMTDQHLPERIGTDQTWMTASAGNYGMAAITSAGQLFTWGYNGFGELGDGTTTDHTSPEQVGLGLTWASASVADLDMAAITTDGQLYAWGYNGHGCLGDGTTTERHSPVRIDPGHTWASVSAGDLDTAAITTDGHLFVWGYNAFGTLGDGTTADHLTPEQLGTQSDWKAVAVWNFATLGVRTGN
jgi:alpha-tubulin suppressor-like RCC1 family protein/ABC-type phosphate transport system substrate-binding protein